MSHWQTFSGEQMLVLAVLLAFLLASSVRPWWTWAAAALISLSLLLAFTRGVWLGCLAALVYLLWDLRRRWLPAIPGSAGVALPGFAAPWSSCAYVHCSARSRKTPSAPAF